jgi:hypothetical protein
MRTLSFAIASSLLFGCIDDEPLLDTTESASTSTSLSSSVRVPTDFPVMHTLITQPPFHLEAGESVVFNSKGTTTSSDDTVRMQELGIECRDANGAQVENIYSTENRNGSTALRAQATRLLFATPTAGDFTCSLYAAAGDFHGNTTAFHTYLANDTYITRSSTRAPGNAWRWGTENDPKYAADLDPDTVHVGPGLAAGTSEYALRSTRFTVPSGQAFIDTQFELELTTCKYGNSNCTSSTRGGYFDQWSGSTVELQIYVQQMASSTSSTVCKLTTSPVQRLSIYSDEVHKKAHLVLSDVPVSSACAGRTFILKALVTWISDNPVEIEPGAGGKTRYSTGFAWGHN